MRNILTLIILLTITFLDIIPAHAEVKFLDVNFNGEERIYYPSNLSLLRLAKNKKRIPIKLIAKKLPLKSSLKENFELVSCSIKNESDEEIGLNTDNVDPKNAVEHTKYRNQRFPSVYLLIPKTITTAKDDFLILFSDVGGFVFIPAICEGIYNLCIKLPATIIQSLWQTAAAPYYYQYDKKDNLSMQKDLLVFNKENIEKTQIICPNEEIMFFILIRKDSKISFTIKIDKDNEFHFYPQEKPPRSIDEIKKSIVK